jgi:Reverse transcriptase (RNA-dependent DNA polymerase)
LYKGFVLADSGAGASVFWDRSLLWNIRRMQHPFKIMGIGGSVLSVYMEADSDFGVVGYHKDSTMNILSIGEIIDTCVYIEISREDRTLRVQMVPGGNVYIFRRVNNQFICDPTVDVMREEDNVNSVIRFVGVATVDERKRMFSRAEVMRADEARELQRKMAYPTPGQIIAQLQRGKIDTRVTASDVMNAVYIFGKSLGECKGKTTAAKPEPETPQPVALTGVRVYQTLYIDLMFEGGLAFLILVFKPLDYIYIGMVKSKSAKDIWVQLSKGLREIYNKGFRVVMGYIDGEKAAQSDLLKELVWYGFNFELDTGGAAEAVPVVEARIRRVKERMRAIYNTLPYQIDLLMLVWLVRFAALRLNGEVSSNSKDGLTARERVYARRNDRHWIRHGYGDYVQIHDRNTSNKMRGRTDGGLALCPTGNMSGTWYYLKLDTWKVVTRNGATALPIPREVIDYINNRTSGAKRAQLEDLEVAMEEDMQEDEALPEDEIAVQQMELITPVDARHDIEGDADGEVTEVMTDQQNDQLAGQPIISDTEPECIDESGLEEEIVPVGVVNNIINSVQKYERVSGPQSRMRIQQRRKERDEMRELLTIPVTKFVALGLQMELHEARTKYGTRAVKAAADEIKQILKKKVFRGVTVEEEKTEYDTKPIPSSMKIKEKFKGGLLDKLKGRLTGGGHKQRKEVFQDIKYAPTVTTTAVMSVVSIAAHEKRAVATLDFTGAFLYADMPTDRQRATLVKLGQFLTRILVKIDPSYEKYVRSDGTCVVVLDKALYGTIIAAAAWYRKISGDMKGLGYTVSKYDNCIFYKNILGKQIIVTLHVDDMFFAAAGGEAAIDIAVEEIKGLYEEVTVHRGKKLNYLGLDMDFSTPGEVAITMTDYANNAVKLFEETYGELTVAKVPANENIFKVDESSGMLNKTQATDYVSHVMRLQYLGKHQRYDILFPLSILNKRVKGPTNKDWGDLKRLMQYVKGTRDKPLILKAGNLDRVTGYIDAAFSVHPDMKGHAGVVVLLGNAPIYVKTSGSKINTKSSTEEELCGMHDYSNMVLWSRKFLNELGYGKDVARIKQDNMSTMDLIYEGRAKALSTKHIDRRYFYVKDLIDRKEVRVVYCRTDMMIADLLTKPLSGFYFERLCNKLMNFGNVVLVPLPKRQRQRVRFADSV